MSHFQTQKKKEKKVYPCTFCANIFKYNQQRASKVQPDTDGQIGMNKAV